jgi:hypothetical protein
MNDRKLSPQLTLALEEHADADQRTLVVFVHATKSLSKGERESLEQLGVDVPSADAQVFTATLSPNQIQQLSSEAWVQAIRLSQDLRSKPAGGGRSRD